VLQFQIYNSKEHKNEQANLRGKIGPSFFIRNYQGQNSGARDLKKADAMWFACMASAAGRHPM